MPLSDKRMAVVAARWSDAFLYFPPITNTAIDNSAAVKLYLYAIKAKLFLSNIVDSLKRTNMTKLHSRAVKNTETSAHSSIYRQTYIETRSA